MIMQLTRFNPTIAQQIADKLGIWYLWKLRRKNREIAWMRQRVVWLLLRNPTITFTELADATGFDHTTLMHSEKAVFGRLKSNPDEQGILQELATRLDSADVFSRGYFA